MILTIFLGCIVVSTVDTVGYGTHRICTQNQTRDAILSHV